MNHPWDFHPRETGATSLGYNVQRVTLLFPWARFDKFAHRIFLTDTRGVLVRHMKFVWRETKFLVKIWHCVNCIL